MNISHGRIAAALVGVATLGLFITSLAPRAQSAGGAVAVQVSGTARTSDIDNSARQPFQLSGAFSTDSQSFVKSFTVPAGKCLVIKGISLNINFVNATDHAEIAVTTTAGGSTAIHTIGLPSLLDSGGGKADFVLPLTPVEIYADPGTTVVIQVAGLSATGAASGSAYGSVTGYQVSLP